MTFTDGTYEIIGSAMRVHTGLGPGLREKPYENGLALHLRKQGLSVEPQKAFPIRYLGQIVGDCIPDLTVNGNVLLEIKSIDAIGENEKAQMANYLRISRLEVGLVINFRNAKLEWQRLIRSHSE